jgi:hypothetical protein
MVIPVASPLLSHNSTIPIPKIEYDALRPSIQIAERLAASNLISSLSDRKEDPFHSANDAQDSIII